MNTNYNVTNSFKPPYVFTSHNLLNSITALNITEFVSASNPDFHEVLLYSKQNKTSQSTILSLQNKIINEKNLIISTINNNLSDKGKDDHNKIEINNNDNKILTIHEDNSIDTKINNDLNTNITATNKRKIEDTINITNSKEDKS